MLHGIAPTAMTQCSSSSNIIISKTIENAEGSRGQRPFTLSLSIVHAILASQRLNQALQGLISLHIVTVPNATLDLPTLPQQHFYFAVTCNTMHCCMTSLTRHTVTMPNAALDRTALPHRTLYFAVTCNARHFCITRLTWHTNDMKCSIKTLECMCARKI